MKLLKSEIAMRGMNVSSIRSNLAMMVFLPSRLITLFTILTLIPTFNVSWQISTQIFQIFMPVYVASFVIEGILTKEGIKKNFLSLWSKYTMGVPVEFAGVASFALLSFSSKPDESVLLGMYVSAVVVACAFFVEVYHHYVRPKLAKIKLTDKQAILVLIPFAVFIVYFGNYYLNHNPFV